MNSISAPDEIISFANDMAIELSYRNTVRYSKCKSYDSKAMAQGMVWHQIAVLHKGTLHGIDDMHDVLEAIFAIVDGEEFYPVAYRCGSREHRFLVRQCQKAFDKLFAQNLRIQLANGQLFNLEVQLNVGPYKFEHISATTKIAVALNRLFNSLKSIDGVSGILNLSKFSKCQEFSDIVIYLGNYSVFERICTTIYRNDDKFRSVRGLALRQNDIYTVEPLKVFEGTQFSYLDLRDNKLRLPTRLCLHLKNIRADELLLAGNPITKLDDYPKCIKSIWKNFTKIDGIPSENLSNEYTPINYKANLDCDGYRIDWSNKCDIFKFENSDDWHAIIIPDTEHEFAKDEIMDYFFITVSSNYSDLYPCYYKFEGGEHQFLVRECFDQLQHLVDNCNLEIKVPRLSAMPDSVADADITALVQIEKTLRYYMRMGVKPFKPGQIQPKACVDKALEKRFSAMDRVLNLNNFQQIEGLENIVFNLSSINILSRILMQAARKFLSNCVELRLRYNKILSGSFAKVLTMMSNLKAIDLGNNWIQDIGDINELQALGLRSITLDGNPLCNKYHFAGEYIKAVKQHFPTLNKLDNVEITSRGGLSTQKNFLCEVQGYDLVEQFVSRFFRTYESEDRLCLKDVYHEHAIFTMTCTYAAAKATQQSIKRISKYAEHARNILEISDRRRAHTSVYVGRDEIMGIFLTLPRVSHDMVAFSTDTSICNSNMVVITVHGVYLDQAASVLSTDMLMAFTRTFVLIPVARNQGLLKCAVSYQIVNEQLNVYTPTLTQVKNAFKYSRSENGNPKKILTATDKEALLVMLQEVTQLKSIWCTRCLEAGEWDFQRALEEFLKLCERKEIPDTAFV